MQMGRDCCGSRFRFSQDEGVASVRNVGTAAAHRAAHHGPPPISTLDLYGRGQPPGAGGRLPLRSGAHPAAGAAAHGIGSGGALLVRPDGFVAWRSIGRLPDPTTEHATSRYPPGGLRAGTGDANCVLQLRRVCCDDERTASGPVTSPLPATSGCPATSPHAHLWTPLVALPALALASIPE
jgi:hypothetical protein